MFGDRNLNVQSNQSNQSPQIDKSNMGIVYHVVLDVDDEKLDILEIADDLKPLYIGAIQFRSNRAASKSDDELSFALPYKQNYISLPTKNEFVRIINAKGGGYYYERIIKSQLPNVNNVGDTIRKSVSKDSSTQNTSKDYSNVQTTNIPRSTSDDSADYDGYGDYFDVNSNLNYLRLYEGDTLIESRFGSSIRFSGYNNTENSFSPTLILRNGENPQTLNAGNGISTEEDINRDGNIILLGSNQYQLPFQPGTVDDKGKTEFETTPLSFKDYPNDLKGNQILLNSDRLIFSAKTSEMIFYSKGNYGFISDGELSIDNKFGIRMNVNDDINITTNDRNVNINSGNGNINLGNTNLESLVKGETLVQLMTELITAIEAMTVATAAGTSSIPINVASFSKVKSQLKTMLSNLNKTS